MFLVIDFCIDRIVTKIFKKRINYVAIITVLGY